MYNEALKQEFIEKSMAQNFSANILFPRIFAKVEIFENKYNKDCYDFSANEILDFYSFTCSPSLGFLVDMNYVLNSYTNMCIKKNLVKDNMNHWSEMTRETLKSCINVGLIENMIISREELLDIAKTLMNPSDAALVLAIFEGFNGKLMSDLTDLTINNFDGNICRVNGKELLMSDELKEYFLQSIETDVYYSINERPFKFAKSDKVFKDQPNCHKDADTQINKRKRLYNKLIRIKDSTDMQCMTLMALKESGRIHKLREYQKQHNCTFHEAMSQTNDYAEIYGGLRSKSEYMLRFNIEE